jgi:ABC-2 type transport system ATP-binding protein
MNVIETTGLGRRFGWTWALRNCSLAVPAGRVTALVGPNGAGKSTLLHLAVGLASPTEGDVRVLGGMAAGSPEALEQVAFVAQNAPLYRHLPVRDMVHLARNLNQRWDQARADRRLAALDIPLTRKIGKLSGGQQAQVALTIALARRPEFLVLDEPLAPLDPLARHQFLASVMEAVAEDGISVLFSSHALTELERVADYLVVLAGGRVQVAGDTGDLLATHRMLTGPVHEVGQLAPAFEVVHGQSGQAQAHALARFRPPTPAPDGWQARPVTLEELVLAYLREPGASALPGPGAVSAGAFTGVTP